MMALPRARLLALALCVALAGGCMEQGSSSSKHLRPLSQATLKELSDKGMRKEDPILVRIYKEENVLEIWKPTRDGRFAHFKSYDICTWSGKLGPKIKEGDKQAPEGFYTVTPAQMNPNSNYYLSFNLGFPNEFDRAHGRTGSHLMVHGACSSAGCYAMEDEQIAEIYALARDSFRGGQREFQVQAFPFRMTPANMARHADNPNMPFWRRLKEGSDHFEVTGIPPKVGVCGRDYVFNASPLDPNRRLEPTAACPPLRIPEEIQVAVAAKQMRDETAYQVALAEIRLQQQQTANGQAVMLASLEEQGSADYDAVTPAERASTRIAEASPIRTLSASAETIAAQPAAVASAATGAATAAESEAVEPVAVQPTGAAGLPAVATAFSGVWGKLVDITGGLRVLGKEQPDPDPAAAETDNADPMTTGSVPGDAPASLPGNRPTGRSAAAETGLPRLIPASAFAPIVHDDDPFAIFDLFATVGAVSVPADMVPADVVPQGAVPVRQAEIGRK
ncbi:murein L,D-transpeptidase YafK [Tepidamorphus gemmatus]|uniref:Murein L,D-transpeptidase YafK n=2 Tax=Tepidamorphus gemmatus TaxID=747076 RepID=A0A4R3M143_9HYPH|nr:murein L,D-transpeptidase YafK [Tepidamorphus gemmatus]